MTTVPITVSIPVGPNPSNRRWLREAIESAREQTMQPEEILLIDDGANLDEADYPGVRIYKAPWKLGVAHAFNFGVALAYNDLVIMLGSDDQLLQTCVEHCWRAWEEINDPHGYYYMAVVYHDGREQNTPCNAAMVHKDLWHLTGGFPVEASVGMCDNVLISLMMASQGRLGQIYAIGTEPIYWYRAHSETDTAMRTGHWHHIAAQVVHLVTETRKR